MYSAIRIGQLSISTYWLMLFVGTVGMLIRVLQRRRKLGFSPLQCAVFTVNLALVGVCGAKLLFILENWEETLANGVSLGGVSFFGSVFLIPLIMPLVGRLFGLRGGQTTDLCASCVAIMIGCMRVGCFLSGCCGGWEVCVGSVCFRWPTQAVESVADFALYGRLAKWEDRGQYPAQHYPAFLMIYGTYRFLIEFLRDTAKDWLCMSHGQWFAMLAIVVGALWFRTARRRAKKERIA